ncbi:UNVERIFIED_CONTAM: hypothetical protein IGO34_31250, partial [Salmonella enterica subsp. enterica serovar Weltevreden]
TLERDVLERSDDADNAVALDYRLADGADPKVAAFGGSEREFDIERLSIVEGGAEELLDGVEGRTRVERDSDLDGGDKVHWDFVDLLDL